MFTKDLDSASKLLCKFGCTNEDRRVSAPQLRVGTSTAELPRSHGNSFRVCGSSDVGPKRGHCCKVDFGWRADATVQRRSGVIIRPGCILANLARNQKIECLGGMFPAPGPDFPRIPSVFLVAEGLLPHQNQDL